MHHADGYGCPFNLHSNRSAGIGQAAPTALCFGMNAGALAHDLSRVQQRHRRDAFRTDCS